jgi:hypothetical protein
MTDLGDSLQRMSFAQLALLFAFLTSYVLTLGGLLEAAARGRAAAIALACAVGFVACTDPWVHGALVVAFVVGGLALFVVLAWLLARLLVPRVDAPQPAPQAEAPVVTAAPVVAPALPSEGVVHATR